MSKLNGSLRYLFHEQDEDANLFKMQSSPFLREESVVRLLFQCLVVENWNNSIDFKAYGSQ